MIPIYDSELAELTHFIADLEASLAEEDAEYRKHIKDFEEAHRQFCRQRLSIRIFSDCPAVVAMHPHQMAESVKEIAALERDFENTLAGIRCTRQHWAVKMDTLEKVKRFVERKMRGEIWEY